MTARSTMTAFAGAALFVAGSVAAATLATGPDRPPLRLASDPASCPPEACSIVVKTEAGGAPSVVFTPTATAAPRSGTAVVRVADATR